MKTEDSLVTWFADLYREGYDAYVRFMCAIYCGEPTAKPADFAPLTSWDAPEKLP